MSAAHNKSATTLTPLPLTPRLLSEQLGWNRSSSVSNTDRLTAGGTNAEPAAALDMVSAATCVLRCGTFLGARQLVHTVTVHIHELVRVLYSTVSTRAVQNVRK